jgi:hypothetical protein
MIICDLCGEAKNCLQKEIEGKKYDICSECWTLSAIVENTTLHECLVRNVSVTRATIWRNFVPA